MIIRAPAMTTRSAIEREAKLGVWPGFALPDLNGALDGAAASGPEEWRLEAVYFDTAELRLLRRGVTLRFRRGEEPGDMWTAKLPSEAAELGLARREISVPGQAGNMPELLADLVRGWALGAPLVPVARLRTLRQRTTLRGPDEQSLAVIDDDEVSIVRGSRVAARFRELELALADGAPPKLLGRLARRLRAAGAQPVDQLPKLVRALGPPALAPWDLAGPTLDSRPEAADLIRAGLIEAAARLVDHLATVVLDEDTEGVHQARVGIRRLRSDLRTVRPLLDAAAVRALRQELKWLADELGEVRDRTLARSIPATLPAPTKCWRGSARTAPPPTNVFARLSALLAAPSSSRTRCGSPPLHRLPPGGLRSPPHRSCRRCCTVRWAACARRLGS
jgi:inorganic triphosphatase YgiF